MSRVDTYSPCRALIDAQITNDERYKADCEKRRKLLGDLSNNISFLDNWKSECERIKEDLKSNNKELKRAALTSLESKVEQMHLCWEGIKDLSPDLLQGMEFPFTDIHNIKADSAIRKLDQTIATFQTGLTYAQSQIPLQTIDLQKILECYQLITQIIKHTLNKAQESSAYHTRNLK
jgi:hypothetical protein